jgi:hypothetical protein
LRAWFKIRDPDCESLILYDEIAGARYRVSHRSFYHCGSRRKALAETKLAARCRVSIHFAGSHQGTIVGEGLRWSVLPIQPRRWFATFDGPVGYEIRDLTLTTDDKDDNVAFTHSANRISGKRTVGKDSDAWVRSTVCYRKIDGKWMVAHEHVSVPYYMETGKPRLTSSLSEADASRDTLQQGRVSTLDIAITREKSGRKRPKLRCLPRLFLVEVKSESDVSL